MKTCYCGRKFVDDKDVDFNKYDIGIEVKFCSEDCLKDFLWDYGYYVISQPNDLDSFEYKIREKEIDGKKVLKVDIIFKDDMRYEACRDTNYPAKDRWLEESLDEEIVKQLMEKKNG